MKLRPAIVHWTQNPYPTRFCTGLARVTYCEFICAMALLCLANSVSLQVSTFYWKTLNINSMLDGWIQKFTQRKPRPHGAGMLECWWISVGMDYVHSLHPFGWWLWLYCVLLLKRKVEPGEVTHNYNLSIQEMAIQTSRISKQAPSSLKYFVSINKVEKITDISKY